MFPREARFLLAATLLHAAIPWLSRIADRPAVLAARSSGAYREVEIEVEPVAPLAPRQDEPRAPDGARPREDAAPALGRTARRDRRGPEAPAPPEAPVEPREGPTAAPAPAPPSEYDGPPSAEGPPGVAGLGGVPVWQLPGVLPDRAPPPPAPTAPPAQREVPMARGGEVLREAMRDRDKTLGLDLPAAGTVASVVADAVRAAETPETARAVFEVQLSGAGAVLGVRALSSTAGAAGLWARVAREAAAQLAGRVLAMTAAFAKGAKVYVTVSSSVKMPSGATSGGIHHQGAGFGFDVADIGAGRHRLVQSSFRVEAID
ncbi:hypothetical protein [Sorangium cellulosum]|uniref:hypothetical protein n=1 Tax=Sorangium cellulosum TaxID=56 RepID=UPI00040BB48F|nr:hypothetical protein [Sorangium cellulosum]